jgi:DNA-binding protein HU-beta
MSKAKLAEALVADPKSGIDTKVIAETVIAAILKALAGLIESEGEVRLPGFGTFKQVHRAERAARNPSTGEPIKVAARTVVKFKPAKDL